MYSFIRDLGFSLRSLRKSPGFTLSAVLALTLGIAGNILIFSVINATLLRPLPYPEPTRLAIVSWSSRSDLAVPAFFVLKDQTHSLSRVAAWYPFDAGVNISASGPPQYVRALSVSRDFFQVLDVSPEIGMPFGAEQDQPGASHTVLLSHGLWTEMFGRDPSTVGRSMWINGESYKIIGIMPRWFRSYPDVHIWLPLQLTRSSTVPGNNYRVVGRLANGVSWQQVEDELSLITREYHSIYSSSFANSTLIAQPFQAYLVQKERPGLATLFAAVILVFLIACTNVAILILVRAAAGSQAIAVRAALVPGKFRLVLSLLGESVLLSLAGGLLGLILAKECLPLVNLLWPADLPIIGNLAIDWRVLVFTIALALLGPLLFGLAPAIKMSRANIAKILAGTSRTATSSSAMLRSVRLLVFAQVMLTVMLLAGTVLLMKSLLSLYSVPLGFNPDNLTVAQVSLAGQRYDGTRSTERLVNSIIEHVQTVPGVESVATVIGLPLDKGLNLPLHPMMRPSIPDNDDEYRPVTQDFFKTFGIPLRSGRFFLASDFSGSTPVAIISETMARRLWPDASPIGHFIQTGSELGPIFADVPRQIVGVVADIREKGIDLPPPMMAFVPFNQVPDRITEFCNNTFLISIVVRSSGRLDLSGQIRNAVQSADPALPLASFRSFNQVIDQSLANRRFITLLTTAFSGFALVLAVIGIHGLLSYQARLRAREIAIRIAVGADRIHALRTVIQQGTQPVFMGIAVGLLGSFLVKRLLGNLLYNAKSDSVVLILAVGLVLGLVATLISLLTAVRLSSFEPMAVLRNE